MEVHLDLRVLEIQNSVAVVKKSELKNALIRDMKQDVLLIARNHCQRNITESDEEFSISNEALIEAIDAFKLGKNAKFITFATRIINNKLTDYYRREKKISEKYIVDDKVSLISDKKNYDQYQNNQLQKELAEERMEEIEQFKKIIVEYGYTVRDVKEARPNHRDSIERLKLIARRIVNANLHERFFSEQQCSKELEKLIGEKRKTLNRYRPYLISLIIIYIHSYSFPHMKTFLYGRDV